MVKPESRLSRPLSLVESQKAPELHKSARMTTATKTEEVIKPEKTKAPLTQEERERHERRRVAGKDLARHLLRGTKLSKDAAVRVLAEGAPFEAYAVKKV